MFFFSLFSPCYTDWVISIVLSSSPLILSSVSFIHCSAPPLSFVISVIIIFSAEIPIWLFFFFFSFAEAFCFLKIIIKNTFEIAH